MTENKRFNYVLGDGFTDYMKHLTATEVCALLNELYDENKELRMVIDGLKQQNQKLKGRLNDLGVEYYG